MATGTSSRASGLRRYAAATSTAAFPAANARANGASSGRRTRSRRAVRGFRASTSRSAQRLKLWPAFRAPTKATTTSTPVRSEGNPPAATTTNARRNGRFRARFWSSRNWAIVRPKGSGAPATLPPAYQPLEDRIAAEPTVDLGDDGRVHRDLLRPPPRVAVGRTFACRIDTELSAEVRTPVRDRELVDRSFHELEVLLRVGLE